MCRCSEERESRRDGLCLRDLERSRSGGEDLEKDSEN